MLRAEVVEAVKAAMARTGSNLDSNLLMAFIIVESGGHGFDMQTGKILIQFEPAIYRNKTGVSIQNKVAVQSQEWLAFNEAFKSYPNAAMESTSIGLPQIMGFHWKRLGYESVGALWDDFKSGLAAQIVGLIRFIETDPKLLAAFRSHDFPTMARCYNGSGYKEQAKRLNITPYDQQIESAYNSLKVM